MSERIGIAGGGAIASGLACVAAEHGQVVLWARRPDAATAKVERLIERRGGAGAGNVLVSDDLGALRDATFVVEAIAEDQAAKAVLLRELGDAARDGTIMATTTSALSVSALAQASGRPQRFLGLHVFNPVAKMDLVELV
nr:3-hydroxyacyl-CoA dehydrogenase family protein [Deltaproteobacteria bacterium]